MKQLNKLDLVYVSGDFGTKGPAVGGCHLTTQAKMKEKAKVQVVWWEKGKSNLHKGQR